jgi:hypothetical protein
MAAPLFIMWNGNSSALTAPLGPIASAATVTPKTMQQLQLGTSKIRVAEWGYFFTTSPTAPVTMELIDTGAVGGTGGTSGIVTPYNDANNVTRTATPSATATCYGPTAEGTITATRLLAATMDLATYFKQQFPLGREPEVAPSNFLRIRVTPSTAAAVSVISYFVWEE